MAISGKMKKQREMEGSYRKEIDGRRRETAHNQKLK